MSEKEIYEAAESAWEFWHEDIDAEPDPEDDYVPQMSVQWLTAFKAGAEWAEGRKGDE